MIRPTVMTSQSFSILYIMGSGRSATTILEILLTSNPKITGVGEITHIFRDGIFRNEICSCGQKTKDCNFWKDVFNNLSFSEIDFVHSKNLFLKFDWHSGFFKNAMGLFTQKEKNDYERVNDEIFMSVLEKTGCKIIVDSSKYAARAIALSKAFPGKVKVICLTRSPAGLIKAFKRVDAAEQKPKKIYSTFLYYVFVIFCCRIAINIIGSQNCVVVTFEQLMEQPGTVLSRIEKLIGICLEETKRNIDQDEFFKIGHIVTGNRLRKKGRVKFKANRLVYKPNGHIEYLAEKIMRFYGKALGFTY